MQRRPNSQVWAMHLRDPLPTVPVPLIEPDPDVPLDLQAAVDACFALVGYERLLDYSDAPPLSRLATDESVWAEAVLKAAGERG